MTIGHEERETGTTGRASTDLFRTDAYRVATDAASTERREIQAEISSLQARVVDLQTRDGALELLVRALRELLQPAPGPAPRYTPSYTIPAEISELRRRAASEPDFADNGAPESR
ncbi:MAG: hypothetical protein ACOH17_07705 [Cellulomonas sp.]